MMKKIIIILKINNSKIKKKFLQITQVINLINFLLDHKKYKTQTQNNVITEEQDINLISQNSKFNKVLRTET